LAVGGIMTVSSRRSSDNLTVMGKGRGWVIR